MKKIKQFNCPFSNKKTKLIRGKDYTYVKKTNTIRFTNCFVGADKGQLCFENGDIFYIPVSLLK